MEENLNNVINNLHKLVQEESKNVDADRKSVV